MMDARVRAGIDLHGTVLRYAEVEQYGTKPQEGEGGQHRLLRLGSCDFDFDVTRALWGEHAAAADQLDTLGDALADVYEGTSADDLRVVVHPPRALSFFAPAAPQASEDQRLEQFRREARLLAASGEDASEEALHVSTRRLRGEGAPTGDASEQYEWFHVLAVEQAVHERFTRLVQQLSVPRFQWVISMEGSARAAVALQERRTREAASEAPLTLAVGRYRQHLELSLAQRGRFHFALHAPGASPADSAYFAAAMLERLGQAPSAVGHVFVHTLGHAGGDEAPDAFSALGRLTGVEPQSLDFRPIVGLAPDRLAPDFAAGPYASCVGAAL